jgi:hypothetical protein
MAKAIKKAIKPRVFSKLIVTPKEIEQLTLDPHLETADTDMNNNHWPPKPVKSRFQLFKQQQQPNPMQQEKQDKKNPRLRRRGSNRQQA